MRRNQPQSLVVEQRQRPYLQQLVLGQVLQDGTGRPQNPMMSVRPVRLINKDRPQPVYYKAATMPQPEVTRPGAKVLKSLLCQGIHFTLF
eukprot:scaffold273892_cov19-Prasinocladus_malaysianus.AAC.1